jgi:hypothetical protein
MMTIHLSPDAILGTMLAAAMIAVVLSRILGAEKPHKRKTRSPKEVDKLEKELARIKKALKE